MKSEEWRRKKTHNFHGNVVTFGELQNCVLVLCMCVYVLVKWHVFKSVDVIYSISLHRTQRTNHFDFTSFFCTLTHTHSNAQSLLLIASSHFHSLILCSLPIKMGLIMCWKAPHSNLLRSFLFSSSKHTAHNILWLKWMGQQNEFMRHLNKNVDWITSSRRKPSRKKPSSRRKERQREVISFVTWVRKGERKREILYV